MVDTNKIIKVLICNKYTLFREGIKALLQVGPPIEVVGEAETAGEAIAQVERLRPDVVLMDMAATDLSGHEATQRIRAAAPNVMVLILSMHDDEPLMSSCMEAGAAGYIRKDERALNLLAAIQSVCRTGQYRNPAAVGGLSAGKRSGSDAIC